MSGIAVGVESPAAAGPGGASRAARRVAALLGALVLVGGLLVGGAARPSAGAAVLEVCASGCAYPTVQAGLDAAQAGDTVLVRPGEYQGGLTVDAPVTLASEALDGDAGAVAATTVRGGSPVITLTAAAAGARVVGLTFAGGSKGLVSFADGVEIRDNRFLGNGSDAVSFEETGGTVRGNLIEGAGDDGIDLDGPTGGVYEGNTIVDSGDDGIESRLFDHTGTLRRVVLRGNAITGSGEDAIQLIDYPGTSDYVFRIERNLLATSVFAGLGIMDGADTVEDFRAATIPERVEVVGNTVWGNDHGISGGGALVAVNNIVGANRTLGVKGAAAVVAHTLLWDNGADVQGSGVDEATTLRADPRLDPDLSLTEGSPAVDAGTATFAWQSTTVLDLAASEYAGTAPDLGWHELGFAAPPPPPSEPPPSEPPPSEPPPSEPPPSEPPPSEPPSGTPTTVTARVAATSDDAEQDTATGAVLLDSSDLELVDTSSGMSQVVGMRFPDLALPAGASVQSAHVELTADEAHAGPVSIDLQGQSSPDAAPFAGTAGALTSRERPKTDAVVTWSGLPAWEVGSTYRTPDLATIVEEVVGLPGWEPGNALALYARGSGQRTAEAFDGDSASAPVLVVVYLAPDGAPVPPPPPPPDPEPAPPPDPSPPGSGGSLDLLPTADTWVGERQPDVTAGGDRTLSVDAMPEEISYLRFDLGALAGTTVSRAVLRLTVTNGSDTGQRVRAVEGAWEEATTTYDTRPALGEVLATVPGAARGTVVEVPLTGYVAAHAGQQVSLGIDATGRDGLDVGSRESADPPVLVVETAP